MHLPFISEPSTNEKALTKISKLLIDYEVYPDKSPQKSRQIQEKIINIINERPAQPHPGPFLLNVLEKVSAPQHSVIFEHILNLIETKKFEPSNYSLLYVTEALASAGNVAMLKKMIQAFPKFYETTNLGEYIYKKAFKSYQLEMLNYLFNDFAPKKNFIANNNYVFLKNILQEKSFAPEQALECIKLVLSQIKNPEVLKEKNIFELLYRFPQNYQDKIKVIEEFYIEKEEKMLQKTISSKSNSSQKNFKL